jgi:sterol desaturase/sphingolipid hydroxylase (fatty acid hydroxylase superfamily)
MQNEIIIRLTAFFGIMSTLMLLETIVPRRQLAIPRLHRWPSNISIVFLNSLLTKLIMPMSGVAMAVFVQNQQWGILSILNPPFWLNVTIAVVLLDMAIYFQHVMFHALPLLWRLHRMHHTDMEFDVTTGNRFHPLEIIISMLIKYSIIILLGPPPLAVIIFEVALNGTAMFNHANLRLPISFDKYLRLFVVTPDMHRVHHSIAKDETNSNFGFNLPWWDRLFGTYRAQPKLGHKNMVIGLSYPRSEKQCQSLLGMLLTPLYNAKDSLNNSHNTP